MINSMTRHDLSLVQWHRRLAITCAVAVVSVALVLVKPVYFDSTYYHFVLEVLGLLCILAAIIVRLWCILYIGGRKATSLMTVGPYSICRNPLYVGSIIGTIGIGLQTGMLTFALLFGFITWLIFFVVVRQEERYLENHFGATYDAYSATTPRFVPRFSRYSDGTDRYQFDPGALRRTFRDGTLFLLALPLTEILEEMHEANQLPALLSAF